MIRNITALILVLWSGQLIAQVAQEPPSTFKRVLVLHGVWKADTWEGRFDDELERQFEREGPERIEVSFRYLGLDSEMSDGTYARLKKNVEDTLHTQSVDLVIGAVSGASRFLMELEGIDHIPKTLVVPGPELAARVSQLGNVGVIPSAADEALAKTIEHILILRPNAETIGVFSGNSQNNLGYMEKAQNIAEQFTDRVNFDFNVGPSPTDLANWAANFDSDSAILSLPYESYGEVMTPIQSDFMGTLVEQTAVPIFGFYDTVLGTGVVGGHVTSTEGYVTATAELTRTMLNGLPPGAATPGSTTASQYDWRQVQKWDLPIDRLQQPVTLLFQPPSLWETNRTLVITVGNIIILLTALSVILAAFLQRSRQARARIAVSERQARISERQYRLLALNSVDVIWTWNAETNAIDYCSPSISTLTGFNPTQYARKKLSDILTPASVETFTGVVRQSPPKADLIEVQHYTHTGETICCEIALQPAQEACNGNLWVAVTRDISQRKQAESERAQLVEKIRQNQKFESLGTLAGGIAHDFNNILGIFVGVAEMLESKVKDNEPALGLLARLRAAIDRAKGLVNQILTFSRRSIGAKQVIDFTDLLRDVLELISVGIPQTVKIDTQITTNPVKVYGDTTQLEQVILNLVTNAYESIMDESGRISVSLRQQRFNRPQSFQYGSVHDDTYAVLEVRDTGTGMEADDLERVFDPFYTSKALGSGMGLAIVHGIVMEHDGCIDVVSTPGEGTTFTLYFPLSELEQANFKAPTASQGIARPLQILVIDDQPELLEVVKLMLREMGHHCLTCTDPRSALSIIDEQHQSLDLIITDYSMPEISGLDIIRYCENSCPGIPVILCSGYGEQIPMEFFETRDHCLFVDKPVDKQALNRAMARLVDVWGDERATG